MGIPINSFLNKVLTEAPRTENMWEVELNSGIDVVDKFFKDFTMYARNFKMPEIGLKYKKLHFRSIPIPVPTSVDLNQEMTVEMYADVTGGVQQSLRAWMTQIIDIDFKGGSYLGGTRSVNAASTMRLHLLDKDMVTVTETCTLIGVTIEKIGDITFTQEESGICRFDVKFQFCWPSYEFPE